MTTPVNLVDYICFPETKSVMNVSYYPYDMTEEEVFMAMDDIIRMQYPGDKTYDVEDPDNEEPQIKKQKTLYEDEDIRSIVNTPCENYCEEIKEEKKEVKTENVKIKENRVQQRILEVFNQMKLKENIVNC